MKRIAIYIHNAYDSIDSVDHYDVPDDLDTKKAYADYRAYVKKEGSFYAHSFGDWLVATHNATENTDIEEFDIE